MTSDSRRIASLVMQMQGAFLDVPALTLTPSQAQQRFNVDGETCGAVLATLVDAKVLARTPDGAYVRRFPRRRSTIHAA